MTKTKSTKRALLMSALSLLMCVSMLIGSTFAWFTDSVTSSGNIIQSGTLDVTMEWKDATANGAQQTYKDASEGAIFNYDKWEPGYVEAKNIKIGNAGTLALKYQLNIVATGEVSKLADVIDVYYAEGEYTLADRNMSELTKIGTLTEVLAAVSTTASGDLLAEEADTVTLALKMQESADNQYQGLSIGSEFAVQLLATQLTAETDSFDDQYDEMADYDGEISNLVSLAAAMENDGTYKVVADITLSEPVTVESDVVLDLNNHTLTTTNTTDGLPIYLTSGKLTVLNGTLALDGSAESEHGTYNSAIGYEPGTELVVDGVTFEGVTGINGTWTADGAVKITVSNSTFEMSSVGIAVSTGSADTVATITNCNITAANYAVFGSQGSKITVNGGTYESAVAIYAQDAGTIVTVEGGTFTGALNAVNGGKIVIKGGTFNQDPSAYVADGYGVIANVDGTYTVVEGTVVSTAADLQSALDSAEDGDVITLGADITGDVTVTQKADVKIVIDGNGKTYAGVILVDGKSGTYTTAGLTIKNMTFKADSISADACIRLGDGTDATRYTCNVTVENCTFDVPGAVGVKSYTGGDKNLTISGCTATANAHSLVQAKGIDGVLVKNCKVYSKNGLNFNNSDNVTVDNCTVDVKGYAVRFGESSGGAGAAETYTIKNSTLKSANDDGDATIILRGTADNSTLTIENTTIVGNPDITNTATNATVVK